MSHHDPSLEDIVDRATPDSAPPFGDVLARRGRRRTRRRAAASGVAAIAVVAAVAAGSNLLGNGTDSTLDPAPAPTVTDPNNKPAPEQAAPDWDGEGVPPLTLMLDDRMVVMAPWSYCYANACIDGMPPEGLDHVGSPDAVRFSFPEPGWTFEATFKEAGDECGRSITIPAEATDGHEFEVPAAGPADDWEVDLFGRGPGGDVIYTFGWTTPTLGTLPEPDGYLGLISVSGDETHVYGAELSINDLASTPANATAVITLTAANGATRTLAPMHPTRDCMGEGQLFFRGPDSLVQGLEDLGPFPYSYTVKLTMDGTTYTGTAVYPDDEIKDLEPYTALTFDPPLPAYMG